MDRGGFTTELTNVYSLVLVQALSCAGPKSVEATMVSHCDFLPVTLPILSGYAGVDTGCLGPPKERGVGYTDVICSHFCG